MDFRQYYPDTPITGLEYQEDMIIIHTEIDRKKETRNIHDLPVFGRGVIIKVSSDASYPWIGKDDYTQRLNKFIIACCKSVTDGNTLEEILALDNVRCSPNEPIEIINSDLSFYKKPPISSHSEKSQNRGAKRKKNYITLPDVLKDILTNGIPVEDDETTDQLSLIPESDTETRHPVSSYRELQDYLRQNFEGMENISLQTLHKTLHSYFPDFSFRSSKSNGLNDYNHGYREFTQIYTDVFISPYDNWMERYKRVQPKPIKPSISGRHYSEILNEVKDKEVISVSVSAEEFLPIYREWISFFYFYLRLVPGIQIKEGEFFLLFMTYNLEEDQYIVAQKYRTGIKSIQIKQDVPVNEPVCLYRGKYTYGMDGLQGYSVLDKMIFPDSGEIEIGIGECVRFSSSSDNYLIPILTTRKYIV